MATPLPHERLASPDVVLPLGTEPVPQPIDPPAPGRVLTPAEIATSMARLPQLIESAAQATGNLAHAQHKQSFLRGNIPEVSPVKAAIERAMSNQINSPGNPDIGYRGQVAALSREIATTIIDSDPDAL